MLLIRRVDPSCGSPLPPGTMGLPFIGETLQLILQVRVHFYCTSSDDCTDECDVHLCFAVLISDTCGTKHAFWNLCANNTLSLHTEKEVPPDETPEVRMHLQNAPLW